ncbi:uncharacterized protein METZ01_LOCUS57290 [marine metagenome]|uniref:Uncharacterized protein n=1 Tax=marine metagenome TaxID=408172 RepID=A0A381SKB8_9ZZZZ
MVAGRWTIPMPTLYPPASTSRIESSVTRPSGAALATVVMSTSLT